MSKPKLPAGTIPAPPRNAKGQWLPGQSANPRGRAPEMFQLAARAREYGDECVTFLVAVLRGEKDSEGASFKHRIEAAMELLNRGFGRPAQTVAFQGVNNGLMRFTLNIGGDGGDNGGGDSDD